MSNHFSLDNFGAATTQQDVLERTEPEIELLVAYLDGELDVQSVRQVEDRLSIEPDLREKMTALEQTWNMLNELETVPVDKELVRSTMEVVTLTIEKELSAGEKHFGRKKWLDRCILAATLLMFSVIGYQLMMLVGIQRNKQFVEDIPIIRKMNMFKEIDSFGFLETLSDKRVFDPVDDDDSSEIIFMQTVTSEQERETPVVETEIQP